MAGKDYGTAVPKLLLADHDPLFKAYPKCLYV